MLVLENRDREQRNIMSNPVHDYLTFLNGRPSQLNEVVALFHSIICWLVRSIRHTSYVPSEENHFLSEKEFLTGSDLKGWVYI